MSPEAASQLRPYREPLRDTLLRTGLIAIAVGAVLAHQWGGLSRWPLATLMAFWPSFGGHWMEIFFLNWLRPRTPESRAVQILARISVWFVGGNLFALAMRYTAIALSDFRPERGPSWWIGGVVFIGIELVVHLVLQLGGRPSFYNGRG